MCMFYERYLVKDRASEATILVLLHLHACQHPKHMRQQHQYARTSIQSYCGHTHDLRAVISSIMLGLLLNANTTTAAAVVIRSQRLKLPCLSTKRSG